MATNEIIKTPEFRVLFPNLFEPTAPPGKDGKPQGEPKYSIVMLFSDEAIKPITEAVKQVAKQAFPNQDLSSLHLPVKRGSEEKQKAEKKGKNGDIYDGSWVVKASSKFPPGVIGPDKGEVWSKDIWSGTYGRAELNIVAYDGVGANPDGVTCYVNFYMKTRDGERLAGRTAQDVFADVEGGSTSEDPTGSGGDDDLPI